MKQSIKILQFIFLFFGFTVCHAQLCGQGDFRLEIYTLNGTEKLVIDYEIFPVNGANRNSITNVLDLNHGSIITTKNALKLIDSSESEQKELSEYLKDRKYVNPIPLKGKLENGYIEFETLETYNNNYILKLSSTNKDIYVIANFFGWCSRTSVLLWSDEPEMKKVTHVYKD